MFHDRQPKDLKKERERICTRQERRARNGKDALA